MGSILKPSSIRVYAIQVFLRNSKLECDATTGTSPKTEGVFRISRIPLQKDPHHEGLPSLRDTAELLRTQSKLE